MKPAIAEKPWGQFASDGAASRGAVDADDPGGDAGPIAGAGMLWMARPSVTVALLSILVTAYLGAALTFAGLEAWTPTEFLVPAFGLAALIVIGLASQIRWAFGVVGVLAATFAAQYHWALLLDPQPFGEFAQLWEMARRLSTGLAVGEIDWATLQMSPSPTATGVYAVSIWALGDDFGAARLVASGLWTVQVYLVWRIAREISELRNRAFAVALIFGLSPTLVVFGGLPSVESVFGLFALSALYLMLTHRRRGLLLSAFLSGVAAGLAFLTQPAAVGYAVALVALLAYGLIQARGWRPRLMIVAALVTCAIGAGVGFAPQVLLNYERTGEISAQPGPALGYQLLLGTNRASGGGYSFNALSEVGFVDPQGGRVSPEAMVQAGRDAERLAFERVKADPAEFARFALTEKLRRLWGSEREMLSWSVGSPSTRSDVYRGSEIERYAPLAVTGTYLAVLLAACVGAARLLLRGGAVTDPARWILLLGAVVGLSLAFLVLEARERHHLAFAPLLALLAPLPFSRLPWIARDAEQVESASGQRRPPRAQAALPKPEPVTPAAPAVQKPSPAVVAAMPVEARLAVVLKGMSKPPRPPEEGAEKPAAAPSKPEVSAPRSGDTESREGDPPARSDATSSLVATQEDRLTAGEGGPSTRRIPPVLAPPVTPQKKHSAV